MRANKLRLLRKGKGLTQVKLAQKAGVSRSVIARYETDRTELSTRNLVKIAKALDVSMDEIAGGGQNDGAAS